MHGLIIGVVIAAAIEVILWLRSCFLHEEVDEYKRGLRDGNVAGGIHSRLHSTISAQQRGMKRQRKHIRRLQNQLKPQAKVESNPEIYHEKDA